MPYAFNSEGEKPMQPRGPLKGWFNLLVESTDYKESQSGGHFIELVWVVMDGESEGRKVWTRLNVDNANEKAVEIARAELTSICHATGLRSFRDERELRGQKVLAKIGQKKRKDSDNEDTVIYEYKPYAGPVIAAPGARAAAVPSSRPQRPLEAVAEDNGDLPF